MLATASAWLQKNR